jgi:hypothetical protein
VSRNVISEEFHSAPKKLTTFALGKSADTIGGWGQLHYAGLQTGLLFMCPLSWTTILGNAGVGPLNGIAAISEILPETATPDATAACKTGDAECRWQLLQVAVSLS